MGGAGVAESAFGRLAGAGAGCAGGGRGGRARRADAWPPGALPAPARSKRRWVASACVARPPLTTGGRPVLIAVRIRMRAEGDRRTGGSVLMVGTPPGSACRLAGRPVRSSPGRGLLGVFKSSARRPLIARSRRHGSPTSTGNPANIVETRLPVADSAGRRSDTGTRQRRRTLSTGSPRAISRSRKPRVTGEHHVVHRAAEGRPHPQHLRH